MSLRRIIPKNSPVPRPIMIFKNIVFPKIAIISALNKGDSLNSSISNGRITVIGVFIIDSISRLLIILLADFPNIGRITLGQVPHIDAEKSNTASHPSSGKNSLENNGSIIIVRDVNTIDNFNTLLENESTSFSLKWDVESNTIIARAKKPIIDRNSGPKVTSGILGSKGFERWLNRSPHNNRKGIFGIFSLSQIIVMIMPINRSTAIVVRYIIGSILWLLAGVVYIFFLVIKK